MKLLNKIFLEVWNSTRNIEPLGNKPVLEIMKQGTDILNCLELNYWCSAGTVLGLVREKRGYITYDTDIDVEVLVNNQDEIHLIRNAFCHKGYTVVREMRYRRKIMQLTFAGPFNILFDIYFYYDNGGANIINHNSMGILRLPKRFIRIKEYCRGFKCPSPINDYLVYRYGKDWMIPTGKKLNWTETSGEALI